MNSRQGALLRALLEASDYRTSADYARRFGCSDRTIRTDVKALNSFFEHEGLATQVGRQRGGRAAPCAGSRRGEPPRAPARGE
ncbi:HTH domain-containing protein [Adlercreutzia rubneri]